jgi:spermidine synthase
MHALIYLLFFCSGLSGLIYQVVWVRAFGNVFGNTVESASLVVAVFMFGLGAGSYVVGRWADARYRVHPESLLRAYGVAELAIAALGLGISLAVRRLERLSVLVSSYTVDPIGWYVFSPASYVSRALVAIGLLLPITVLMGGTLTLLIRHLVRKRPSHDAWAIAGLYAINTAGAALGCFAADFWLLPAAGLLRTQLVAVAVNAAVGALALVASTRAQRSLHSPRRERPRAERSAGQRHTAPGLPASESVAGSVTGPSIGLTGVAVAMSGFAAVGLEIVWFRHFAIQLGAFRAVFSLLLTTILIGIGAGSLAAAWLLHRPTWRGDAARAGRWLIVVQGLLAATTLAGVGWADVERIDAVLARVGEPGIGPMHSLSELWFNLAPMLAEVAVPAVLMGFGFPLANAMIQRVEGSVGRRAGALYFANTAGSVAGSLAAGFVLLPGLGLQRSVALLALAFAGSAVPLCLALRQNAPARSTTKALAAPMAVSPTAALALSILIAGTALVWWLRLPSDAIILRALPRLQADEKRLTLHEGLTEVIEITDVARRGRRLLTNGHPMSATWPLSQRYMRALAHLPLLAVERPTAALVIGYGVGNSTHAVTLHPSIARIEVADLSRGVLDHSEYFASSNRDALKDRRVSVFINDGRHHLLMRPSAAFDVITLEPPPIGYAGAAALYSKEFYALARSRLRPGGYMSQWLPVYQVPATVSLAMVRAFIDIFPEAVLVSGAGSDLLLIGTNGSTIQVDPDVLYQRLSARPDVQADLTRLDLGTVPEIVGTFVGSAATLREATRDVAPATDDRPVQEYAVRSLFTPDTEGLTGVADLSRAADWCPRCYRDGKPVGHAAGLDLYLSLLGVAYSAPPAEFLRTRNLPAGSRRIIGSAYLGAVLPESAAVHNLIGVALASRGSLDQAIEEFRRASVLSPAGAETQWHLGAALAAHGQLAEALGHLRQAVELEPRHGQARYDLARLLLQTNAVDEALAHLRIVVELMPDSADAHNDLGAVLARQGRITDAVGQFQRALALRPGDPDAQRNLLLAEQRGAARSNSPGSDPPP